MEPQRAKLTPATLSGRRQLALRLSAPLLLASLLCLVAPPGTRAIKITEHIPLGSEEQAALCSRCGGRIYDGWQEKGGDPGVLVCGNDGLLYTECDLRQAQCLGKKNLVESPNFSLCFRRASNRPRNCFSEQSIARLEHRQHVPSCANDGTYSPEQCLDGVSHCWCVLPATGQLIADSHVTGRRPRCSRSVYASASELGSAFVPAVRYSAADVAAAARADARRPYQPPMAIRKHLARVAAQAKLDEETSAIPAAPCTSKVRNEFNERLLRIFVEEARRTLEFSSVHRHHVKVATAVEAAVEAHIKLSSSPSSAAAGSATAEAAALVEPEVDAAKTNLSAVAAAVIAKLKAPSRPPTPGVVEAALWKFAEIDKDGDGKLASVEYLPLMRLVRRRVKPARCGRTMVQYADRDADGILTRDEWLGALGLTQDGNAGSGDNDSSSSNNREQDGDNVSEIHNNKDVQQATQGPYTIVETDNKSGSSRSGTKKGKPMSSTSGAKVNPAAQHQPTPPEPEPASTVPSGEPRQTDQPPDKIEDCATSRSRALEESQYANQFIPECNPDGLTYKQKQCYNGLCFCVTQDTGRVVTGSANREGSVNCTSAKNMERVFDGCSTKRRRSFVKHLAALFIRQRTATANTSLTLRQALNRSENLALVNETLEWKFAALDVDGSNELERDEWRSFRREWKAASMFLGTARRRFARCWQNTVRYCDENNDRRIAHYEWTECIGARLLRESPIPKGRNPFVSLLKAS